MLIISIFPETCVLSRTTKQTNVKPRNNGGTVTGNKVPLESVPSGQHKGTSLVDTSSFVGTFTSTVPG